MTPANVEHVEVDIGRANDFVAQAKRFIEDAERPDTNLESAVVLYWSGCLSAMDALLTLNGLRIGRGDSAHALRVSTAASLAGEGYAELFERLDEWRRERNDVSYAAVTPSAAVVAAMQADARDVLALVITAIRP